MQTMAIGTTDMIEVIDSGTAPTIAGKLNARPQVSLVLAPFVEWCMSECSEDDAVSIYARMDVLGLNVRASEINLFADGEI